MDDSQTAAPADASAAPVDDSGAPVTDVPVTLDAVDVNRQAASDANQNGPDAELVECPTCGNLRRKFLIVNDMCDSCRTANQPAAVVATLGWPEVRARRDRVIQTTDWTQLGDTDPTVKQEYIPLRKRLRDVTTFPDEFKAWYELDSIEAAIAAL